MQPRAAPAWHDLAAGAAAAAPGHHHFRIGLIVLVILVLGGLGFGAVRLSDRARLNRQRRAVGPAPETPGPGPQAPAPARLAAGPALSQAPGAPAASAPAPRAPVSFGRPDGGWAVETHGLTKRFGTNVAVDDVELLVPRGSAFGYLGPNGAGKTTLIRTLLGLTRADAGTMALLGIPVPAERSRALARVGAIVDEPRFHPHLTGRDNLRLLALPGTPATSTPSGSCWPSRPSATRDGTRSILSLPDTALSLLQPGGKWQVTCSVAVARLRGIC